MKNTGLTTKRIGILGALVILILLLIICITNCGKQTESVPAPETAEAPQMATQTQTEAWSVITVATTAPMEETTVPTEETMAATSAPTTAVTDSVIIETEAPEDYVDIPSPGSPENPYVEVISGYPSEVESVYIFANHNISYLISGAAGSVLTLEDQDMTLSVDGKECAADADTGAVVLDLSKLGKDPIITLKNTGTAASNCIVKLEEGIGGAGNPEILIDPAEILVELPEEDTNGYHYKWTATTDGTVELELKKEISEDTPEVIADTAENETEPTEPEIEDIILEIVATVGGESARLTEKEDGKLSVAVKKNEDVLIQVISVPWKDGYYPEINETVLWQLIPDLGTAENPQALETLNAAIPVALEAGDTDGWHWMWAADRNGQITLTPPERIALAVSVDGTAVTPAEGEHDFNFRVTKGQQVLIHAVASVEAENAEKMLPAVAGGNITGTFLPDPGAPENPAVLESIESVSVMLEADDTYGYACTWTAQQEGKLIIAADNTDKNAEIVITTAAGASHVLGEESLMLNMKAGETVNILVKSVVDEMLTRSAVQITLKGAFEAIPGVSPENPIVISAEPGMTSVSMEAWQTLYFSGMLHEMMATVEDANGVSIHFEDKTAWGDQTGTAIMEFPEAETEEPILFSVTSRSAKDLTMSVGYPMGHEKNPAKLALADNRIQLKENDEDGYLLHWTADCDGLLTVTMEDHGRWQYQIDNLTAGEEGQLHTGADEVRMTSETLEVKEGDLIQVMVKTFDLSDPEAMPAGNLKVSATFVDPLLGTEAKPIRLDNTADVENSVVVPAGKGIYYCADADGMILTFRGSKLMLQHNEDQIAGDNTGVEIQCQGTDCVFLVMNATDKDQTCSFRFTYPLGHRENPMDLTMGENKAVLEDSNLLGCAFAWTAESDGQLTVTMPEEEDWQFVLYNKTAGVNGIVHISQDDPRIASEMLEVSAGDKILVIVNSFDLEHPLHTPAREIVFTAEFVDPTLGMEENPVWLNQNGELAIPAGKTMYCTAKVDGMLLTLKGTNVTVSHNEEDYLPDQDTITFLCHGTGTFGHPVFAVTNTGAEDAVYSISFEYPEGHFMNPAEIQMGENTAYPAVDEEYGYHYLWTADVDGILGVTMTAEDNWTYSIANLTTGEVGQTYSSEDEEIVDSDILEVKKGDQIRIVVNVLESGDCGEGVEFRISVVGAETE